MQTLKVSDKWISTLHQRRDHHHYALAGVDPFHPWTKDEHIMTSWYQTHNEVMPLGTEAEVFPFSISEEVERSKVIGAMCAVLCHFLIHLVRLGGARQV